MPIWWGSARFSSCRAARERKIEASVARSVFREMSIGEENYERSIIPPPLRHFEVFERHRKVECNKRVFLPHGLIPSMRVVAFTGVDFVALLVRDDLDFPEFSIPVPVLRVVAETVLVMEFI